MLVGCSRPRLGLDCNSVSAAAAAAATWPFRCSLFWPTVLAVADAGWQLYSAEKPVSKVV